MAQKGKGESAAHAACVCGPARECGQKAQAEAHIEHGGHVCDAGGVEAQRLVESSRILPSPKGAPDKGRHAWPRDGTDREGRISSARGVRVWPGSGVWAGGVGGSAHGTWRSCL
eukprot:scaffold100747_cov54-Phaeocystis_antarctica.AAC.1